MLDDESVSGLNCLQCVCVGVSRYEKQRYELHKFINQPFELYDAHQIPFILVGNKVDLLHLRKVTFSEASARAAEWNCPYVETSAKTRQNVEEVYTQLMRKIRDRKERISKREGKGKKAKCLIL